MTEGEWLRCNQIIPLVEYLANRTSDRKLRLFGCACARMVWHLLDHQSSRQAIEVAERFADGRVTQEDALAAGDEAMARARSIEFGIQSTAASAAASTLRAFVNEHKVSTGYLAARMCAKRAAHVLSRERGDADPTGGWDPAEEDLIPLLRDICGNPFRPLSADPRWLTSTVVELARGIYAERAFDRLPILADALQDAGCDSADVLDHCRGDGPHVRGCWVVDLVLGKT
jgi:hypothetical protein